MRTKYEMLSQPLKAVLLALRYHIVRKQLLEFISTWFMINLYKNSDFIFKLRFCALPVFCTRRVQPYAPSPSSLSRHHFFSCHEVHLPSFFILDYNAKKALSFLFLSAFCIQLFNRISSVPFSFKRDFHFFMVDWFTLNTLAVSILLCPTLQNLIAQ